LGKVNALPLVNVTVPRRALISPFERDTAPAILNIPVDTFIVPDVNVNEPTAKVPEPKVNVPELVCV